MLFPSRDLLGRRVAKHLKNIFDSGELDPSSTVSKLEAVRQEGQREVTRAIELYSLDAVFAEGYRVNSYEARTR